MFKHYLTTALRYFSRNKFTTSINVLCLAMGMTCFAAAYGVVAWFSNADRHYANSDRIFFLTESLTPQGAAEVGSPSPLTSWVLGSLARANLTQLPAVARLTPTFGGESPISIHDGSAERKTSFAATAFADPELLEIFDLPFIAGNSKAALRSPRSAIVTAAMAQRIFGRTDVVGQTILLRNREHISITGVVSEFKQPSHFGGGTALISFEMLVSMDTYESIIRGANPTRINELLNTWGANMGSTVYVLTPDDGSVSQSTLNAWVDAIAQQHAPTAEGTFHVGARPIWELYTTLGDSAIGAIQTGVSSSAVLLVLGGLILLVSCINYANLATAQLSTRAREVAMRRVVGAGRLEIIRQYLFETGLLTLVALAAVMILMVLVLGILGSIMRADLIGTVVFSGELWSALLATLVVVTLIAGAYPALVLSRMRPLQALRAGNSAMGARFVPTLLVGIQFGTASFLLIAVLVMQAQNREQQQQRDAAASEPVLAITSDVRDAGVDMQVLRNELLRNPYIETVAAADEPPGGLMAGNRRFVGTSLDAGAGRVFATTNSIDHNYFTALNIDLVAGRNFDPSQRDEWNQATAGAGDVMNVVINSAMAERVGWINPADAVGQTIYGLAGLGEHPLTMRVIGVTETKPLVLLGPFGSIASIYTLELDRAKVPIVRFVNGKAQEALTAVETTWQKLSPNVPLRRTFLDESYERTLRILPVISSAFAALALFAFLISAMGLIGMASHVTARRTREIGVRKTLGASVARILGLLLRDFSKPVIVANVLMWPLAYVVMQGYLSMFMVQTSLTAVPFLLGLAITVGIACASVGLQAAKAARMNPAMVLRHE
jgi:putative ABC transport system permease protein